MPTDTRDTSEAGGILVWNGIVLTTRPVATPVTGAAKGWRLRYVGRTIDSSGRTDDPDSSGKSTR